MSVTRHQAVGAYRRWEPQSFDENAPMPEAQIDEPAPLPEAVVAAEPETEPVAPLYPLPTAEEIEAMFEQARREGHAEGRAEGLAAGLAEGRAEGEKRAYEAMRIEAEKLASVVANMDAALDELDGQIAEELVILAIELARQMVHHTLADHPTVVAETVREALQQLPHNEVRVHLHPDDAALVADALHDTLEHGHHRIVEDDSITRGGCRLEAAGSDMDATMETRWRRVLESLGRTDASWGG